MNLERPETVITLDSYLAEQDEMTRAGRVARASELIEIGEPQDGRMLFGDAHPAFWEAQSSYVLGNDLAVVLTTQACLEKLLSGLFEFWGMTPADTLAGLLRQGREQNLLSDYEFTLFDRMRRTRNPHAHFRNVNSPEHPMQRAQALGTTDPTVVLHQDARGSIRTLIELVNRPPFALGPVEQQLSHDEMFGIVHPGQLRLDTSLT